MGGWVGGRGVAFGIKDAFLTLYSYFRRFYDNRMEVGMLVNSVNASSVFLRN